jgi:hypothetical protein
MNTRNKKKQNFEITVCELSLALNTKIAPLPASEMAMFFLFASQHEALGVNSKGPRMKRVFD